MTDLLESVEELNPANKQPNKRYRFPFSTVLVEVVNLGRIWIDRTGYKTLTTTKNKEKGYTGKKEKGRSAKTENERTDRKFYEIALHQVKRYQGFIGATRLGQERTPTPLEESPEPQGSSRNGQSTSAQQSGPAQSGPAQSGQNQSGQGRSGQGRSGQGQSGQGRSGQGQSGQGQNGQSQDGQSQDGQSVVDHSNDKPRTIRSFYEDWLKENNLSKGTAPEHLSQEQFGKFKAAAHSYVDKYTADTNLQVLDDMDILK